jgi:hypothetical protein
MMDIEQNGWIGGTTQIERDDFSSNRHPALSFDLSMDLRANASRLSRGKTGAIFPDHALVSKNSGEFQGDAAC